LRRQIGLEEIGQDTKVKVRWHAHFFLSAIGDKGIGQVKDRSCKQTAKERETEIMSQFTCDDDNGHTV
jgi:hypothetical protein